MERNFFVEIFFSFFLEKEFSENQRKIWKINFPDFCG